MRNATLTLLSAGLLPLLLVACGDDDPAAAPPDEVEAEELEGEEVGDAPAPAAATIGDREDADLLIWADQLPIPALRELAADFEAEHGLEVAIQEVGFDEIRGQLQSAGPAGEGPDLIVGAHDWLGELVLNGSVASLELPDPERFEAVALEAFTWDGQLYGLPHAIENLALYRNTDHVPEAPETWEELEDIALELQADGTVAQGLMIPVAQLEAPYHLQPLFTAAGGYVFAQRDDGTYDPSDVGIDTEGGLEAARILRGWVEEGLLNPDVDGGIQQAQFGDGQVAFAISGPWSLRQDGAGFEETGVEFEVSPFPPLEGNTMQPFVGVQGMMVSAFSDNPLLAKTFLTQVMTTDRAQLAMFEANTRPPALTSAFEQVVADDPTMAAFGEAGVDGQPMPAVPAMSTVFSAMGDAYRLVLTGGAEPEQAMESAANQIRQAVDAG
jgi:arabinogalactan oligomer / maltooligosaccharide transport system substrate-binding protein